MMPTTRHSAPTIRRLATFCAAFAAAAALAAVPAHAAMITEDHSFGCSAHGFTGTFRYVLNSTGYHWYYRINKGSNSGGNNANVNISDYGTNPMTWWKSPDTMIQDNNFHAYPTHTRGDADFDVTFIFDLAGAGDPSCVAYGGSLI